MKIQSSWIIFCGYENTNASFFKTKDVSNASMNSNTTPESNKLSSESQTACDTAISYLSNPTTEPSSPTPVVVAILEDNDWWNYKSRSCLFRYVFCYVGSLSSIRDYLM